MLKKHDFVELDYTGKLENGTIFDTTLERVAKENHLHEDEHHEEEKPAYKPIIVCIGELQVVKGLDEALIGKEPEAPFTVKLSAEQAFGKKDVKLIKLIPMSTFHKQEIMPYPGLRINIDDTIATVLRVSGGRVLVDYNHPLANKTIIYDVSLRKRITDKKQQIESYLAYALPLPCTVHVNEKSAAIETEPKLPQELIKPLADKLNEVTGMSVEFKQKNKKEKRGKEEKEEKEEKEDSINIQQASNV